MEYATESQLDSPDGRTDGLSPHVGRCHPSSDRSTNGRIASQTLADTRSVHDEDIAKSSTGSNHQVIIK